MVSICTFKQDYYNYQFKQTATFRCDQISLENRDLCLFHDKDYLKDKTRPKNKDKVIEKLIERIDESNYNNKPLYCIGYNIPDIRITKKFSQPVYFSFCTFAQADFSRSIFTNFAYFNGVVFSGNADFTETRFIKTASFSGSNFLHKTSLIDVIFRDNSYFRSVTFLGKSFFTRSIFELEADFSGSIFEEEVNFSYVTFSNKTLFISSKFSKSNFIQTKFLDNADISEVKFNDKADFTHAIFIEKVYFSGSIFSKDVRFDYTTFSKESYFSRIKFALEVSFKNAVFMHEANFTDTVFNLYLYIQNATFKDKTHFSCQFQEIALFNFVTFENPRETIFEVKDMSNVSFINTNITEIRFSDIVTWGGIDNYQIIEETWLEEDEERANRFRRVSLGGVLSVYRNLRENYELRRMYDEAGKFFIREMELKRKYREVKAKESSEYKIKKNYWSRRNIFSLIGWYHLLSNYGESLWRPTVAGMVIVFLFTLLFGTQSNPYQEPFSNIFSTTSRFVDIKQLGDLSHWLMAFVRTMGDFIPLLSMPSDIKIGLVIMSSK